MSDKPNLVERVAMRIAIENGHDSWDVVPETIFDWGTVYCREDYRAQARKAIEEVGNYLHEELGDTYTATGTRIRVMLRKQVEGQ